MTVCRYTDLKETDAASTTALSDIPKATEDDDIRLLEDIGVGVDHGAHFRPWPSSGMPGLNDSEALSAATLLDGRRVVEIFTLQNLCLCGCGCQNG
jgi:hypothetical protein